MRNFEVVRIPEIPKIYRYVPWNLVPVNLNAIKVNSNSKMYTLFFVLLVETWLHNKILKSKLNLSEYDIHRRDRTSKKGGGIILCVKKSLNSIFLKKSKQIGMHFCKVRCPQKAHIYINLPLDATDFKIHIKQSSLAITQLLPIAVFTISIQVYFFSRNSMSPRDSKL